jgi:hypothetical protein
MNMWLVLTILSFLFLIGGILFWLLAGLAYKDLEKDGNAGYVGCIVIIWVGVAFLLTVGLLAKYLLVINVLHW